MDKYRRVEKSKNHDESPVEANEIRITQQGNVRSYISYANGLFADKNERGIVLKAMGNAISKAVTVAEILKHRVEHLHQITQISSIETVDVYEPLEEGLDRIETKRHIPSISIQLSLDQLNKEDPGYQSPIPVELVSKSFDDRNDTRKPFAARKNNAKRSEKNKKGKAAAAGPATSGGEDDEVEDQENAKSRANSAAAVATGGGGEDGAAKEGKPARGDYSTKRGRGRGGRTGGRGAGRKPRENNKSAAEGGESLASDEAKPSSSGATEGGAADATTGPKKAKRTRKPRSHNENAETNGESFNTNDEKAEHTTRSDDAEDGAGDRENGRTSNFRGRGRGRSRGRGRGGRGGRGRGEESEAPVAAAATPAAPAPVAAAVAE